MPQESYHRLFGPTRISDDPDNPEALFTVPSVQQYTIRDALIVADPVTGDGETSVTTIYIDDEEVISLSPDNAGRTGSTKFSGGVPVQQGEAVTAVTARPSGIPILGWGNGSNIVEFSTSTAGPLIAGYDGQAVTWITSPVNRYSFMVAGDPDVTLSPATRMTDEDPLSMRHSNYNVYESLVQSVSTQSMYAHFAVSTVNYPIAANDAFYEHPTVGASYHGAAADVSFGNMPFAGLASTDNVIAQIESNSGTAASSGSVTITPQYSDSIMLVLVNVVDASAITLDPQFDVTTLDERDYGALIWGAWESGLYICDTPETNPTINFGVTADGWQMIVVELRRPQVALTVTGIVHTPVA